MPPKTKTLRDLPEGVVTFKRNFVPASWDCFNRFEREMKYESADTTKINMMGKWIPVPRQTIAFGDQNCVQYKFTGSSPPIHRWEEFPLLSELRDLVEAETGTAFNYALVQRYRDGQHYIGYHQDDEKQLVPESDIAGLSFGAQREILFKHIQSKQVYAVPLPGHSLIVMHNKCNQEYKHSIPKRAGILYPRVSVTFRQMQTTS